MTAYLLIAAGLVTSASLAYALRLRHDLAALRIRSEEDRTWADEWERQATERAQELAEMRQEYAKILWLHDGRMIQPLGQAWRAGVGKSGLVR